MPSPNERTPAAAAIEAGRDHRFESFRLSSRVAKGAEGKPGSFSMLAYSGVPFKHPYWGNFAVDLSTIKLKGQKIPILREHEVGRIVGFTDSIKISDMGIEIEGSFSKSTMDGKEVLALSEEGFPWEASIAVPPGSIESIQAGSDLTVNGHKIQGPGTIFRNATLKEASFVTNGADPRARARALSADAAEEEIIFAFSEQKEGHMADTTKAEAKTPATPAPVTFSEDEVNAKVQEAIKARRDLDKQIREFAAAGQEKLAQDLIDRGATFAEASMELGRDMKAKLGERREALRADPGAGLTPKGQEAPKAKEPEPVDELCLIKGKGLIDEEAAKVIFKGNASLQKEFFFDEGAYLSYLKAASRGHVTTKI